MKSRYKVIIFFRDETDRVHRKEFNFKSDVCMSVYELFKWAEMFGAEKIIFKKED